MHAALAVIVVSLLVVVGVRVLGGRERLRTCEFKNEQLTDQAAAQGAAIATLTEQLKRAQAAGVVGMAERDGRIVTLTAALAAATVVERRRRPVPIFSTAGRRVGL